MPSVRGSAERTGRRGKQKVGQFARNYSLWEISKGFALIAGIAIKGSNQSFTLKVDETHRYYRLQNKKNRKYYNTMTVWKTHLTAEEACKMAESAWYEGKTNREIVEFQLFEEKLCMPLSVFHQALEDTLERPVQTIEMSSEGWGALQREFLQSTD